MANIELSTVPAETTIDIYNDKIPFIDISESPDAMNTMLPKVLREALFPGTLWVDDYASVQAAFDAIVAAAAGSRLVFSNATYGITATTTLAGLVNKTVEGNGAVIQMSGGSNIYGIQTTGVWYGSKIRDLNFTTAGGGGLHLGIYWTATGNSNIVSGCTMNGLVQAIAYANPSVTEYGANYFVGNSIVACTNTGIVSTGEYVYFIGNSISSNVEYGIQIKAGNNFVIDNTITFNNVGVFVDSNGISNADHGLIKGNAINHNEKCGVYLKDLLYSMDIHDNEIWATSGANLGSAPQNSSFGIYVKNGTGVSICNNSISRNVFSIGIEGMTMSKINGNTFLADSGATSRHVREVGGTNNTYLIDGNMFEDNLAGGNTVVLATDAPGATLGTNIIA